MSHRNIYTCDTCKAEQPTRDQFWYVGVYANTNGAYRNDYESPVAQIEVCRVCLEKLGIHDGRPVEQKAAEPAPTTVEDLVRELIARCSQ